MMGWALGPWGALGGPWGVDWVGGRVAGPLALSSLWTLFGARGLLWTDDGPTISTFFLFNVGK